MQGRRSARRVLASAPVRKFRKTRLGWTTGEMAKAGLRSYRAVSVAKARPAGAAARGPAGAAARARHFDEDGIHRFHDQRILQDHVFYEASDGVGMIDSPRAIFEYLLDHPDYGHLHHVWCLATPTTEVPRRFRDDPRISFVHYRSAEYWRLLTTSAYLVNNTSFPRQFLKRPGQTYLNTWHGVPMKRMGYDLPAGATSSRNILRNFLAADYVISASPYMTDTMYRKAYPLEGLFRGTVLETGQPRTDATLQADPVTVRQTLRDAGVIVDDRKVLLYAPTWRGDSFADPDFDLEELVSIHEALCAAVDLAEYQVLFKVHQFVARVAQTDWRIKGWLVPEHIPANEVLGITDVLITDYSSIFLDFLPLDRPILFYVPDARDYSRNRGVYVPHDEWPGQVLGSLSELQESVRGLTDGRDDGSESRHRWADIHAPHDDGRVTARVVDVVFGGGELAKGEAVSLLTEKTRLAIYAGGLFRNGITTSLLALLDQIDYDRYDVTLLYNYQDDPVRLGFAERINRHVRHVPRIGKVIQSPQESIDRKAIQSWGLTASGVDEEAVRGVFAREWRRCFGDATFDHVIDFSGYNPFWSYLCLAADAPSTSIWVHNELYREVDKLQNGKRLHGTSLPAVFSMYHRFTHIVSVSEGLDTITRRDLGRFGRKGSFRHVRNMVDFAEVQDRATGSAALARRTVELPENGTVREALAALSEAFSWPDVMAELNRQRLREQYLGTDRSTFTFVSIGRLSPEKNQERLIRAFAHVRAQHRDCRLIVFGEGPSRAHLEGVVRILGLTSSVTLAGHEDNALAVLADSDCFVFSSDYEGQGLVLLEAMALGVPVVTTRFDVVDSVVGPDEALVVDRSVEALAAGMLEAVRGQVPSGIFQPGLYVKKARQEFESLVHAHETRG
jgi:CDP-glycerol glycerophosphotransferase